MHMEHVIDSYRKGFLEFARDWQDGKEPGQEGQKGDLRMEDLKMVIEKYNQSVEEFSRNLQQYGIGEISEKMLLIRLDWLAWQKGVNKKHGDDDPKEEAGREYQELHW